MRLGNTVVETVVRRLGQQHKHTAFIRSIAPQCVNDIKGHGDWQKVQGNVAHLVDVGYGHLRVACVWEGKRVDLYWEIPALAGSRGRHYPQLPTPNGHAGHTPAARRDTKSDSAALPLPHPALDRRQSTSHCSAPRCCGLRTVGGTPCQDTRSMLVLNRPSKVLTRSV